MSGSFLVAVLDHLSESSVETEVLGDIASVRLLTDRPPDERSHALQTADAILMWHIDRLTSPDFDLMNGVRIVQRVGVGFDNVDLPSARRRGIPVCTVPDYGTEDVADHAVALMLALSRALPAYHAAVLSGPDGWSWRSRGRANARLRGQRLGIVGCGRIGTAVALRARAFGLDVVFHDPYVAAGYEKSLGVRRAAQLADLADCDILTVHVPLMPETRGLIGEAFWAAGTTPVLAINTARGGIFDEAALAEAFRRGRVRGLGFDVLEREPLDPDSPIGQLLRDPAAARDIILTPHSAFFSDAAYREMREKAALNVRRCLLDGQWSWQVS